ncbi:glycosyl transferase group 1 [[Leptolyngbya] sp. PCC 7376]|uniref:glycosyltransferase family 4 protein n=1 Tax=[Leptolyngbya] sp. PCC 7376 TaxID=111781 RepID=UPI00029F45D9|nr:glycosyltransferase family 1 protein [[Leptolyngbya] sp. PCC 7376]AFY36952.1 glycosyl transferase group 1 [[Leptolyngbya] sp. PCC 7376]
MSSLEPSINNDILVNLSFFSIINATGIVRYSDAILDGLQSINPIYLINLDAKQYLSEKYNFQSSIVSDDLTANSGKIGHIKRLIWSQFMLPKIYKKQTSTLVFSPISEAALFTSCRQVVMIHDFIPLRFPNWRSPLYPYHRFYVPEVTRQAEHLICNSEATARDIVKFCGVSAKKISPILLGYDQEHFQPTPTQDSSATSPYFLYVGRHDPHKNLARVINAFQAGKFSDKTELWLVGSEHPRHTPALRQQILELGLTERVKFLDYVPYADLPTIISEAIALVFPSLWEGFGLPILEAMGCGTPVITSNLASMPEVAGDAAILVDPYNTNEISDAMQAIATDSALRMNLSELGLARAKLFSWEKTGRETVEVLKRFL